MTQELFEQLLRENIRRKPFLPFVVEMNDGKRIIVDNPSVAFNDGGAVYVGDDRLDDFVCEDVKSIRLVTVAETTHDS
jgi:hypothetical protein